ncbi:hypothetical protein [Nocardia sp. NPDC051832]|uniref:hypothetical protein n=1 Tax=Nocardia sp. NPDC051832 TaxID=3155673 RepID=UPI003417C97A
MFEHLSIGTWVIVGENCSVRRAQVGRDDYLTYVFESGGSEFEFALAPAILRKMVDLGDSPPDAVILA